MHHFTLPDMSCGHCVAAITEAVQAADAQAKLQLNREARTADIDSALPREAWVTVLTDAGYPPAPATA
ncbi:heavy-metal-associated domain-containing protein [Roseateles sp. BYS87W]|uniref:Heavy-metal-associated domain-containing protein n=1 Tax=Pelomonas baiyunensis TaxID=3299026 RepID=A0ABW7H4U7_9BURK